MEGFMGLRRWHKGISSYQPSKSKQCVLVKHKRFKLCDSQVEKELEMEQWLFGWKKSLDQEALDHSNNYIIIIITHCDSNDTSKGPTTTLTWTAILVSSNIDLDYPFQIFAPHFKFISSQKNWKALFALYLGKAILGLRSQNLRCDLTLTLKSCNFTMV